MVRVKARWNAKNRRQTPEDMGGVLAVNAWKIAGELLLHLENEDFQIDTHRQRLDILEEVMIFLVHLADRMVYGKLDDERRAAVIRAMAIRTAELFQENREELYGPGEYKGPFIEKLNERVREYAEYPADEDGPGFAMSRCLGRHVAERVGERHRQWVGDQIIDIEVPDMLPPFRKAVKMMLDRE